MHLDHDNCMEVTVLKGRGSDVQDFANRIIAERGVRHGHVVYLPAGGAHDHGHDRSHDRSHDHSHDHSHGHSHARGSRGGGARKAKASRS
jgi:CopG family nickel-responsive transcriptional regulator